MSADEARANEIDAQISKDLNMDVRVVELVASFQLDLARIQRGETSQLGYILIDRQYSQDLAVVYLTPAKADEAIVDDQLIDGFCEEDCLDANSHHSVTLSDISGREIVLQVWPSQ